MDEKMKLLKKEKLQMMALREHYKLLSEEEWDQSRHKRI